MFQFIKNLFSYSEPELVTEDMFIIHPILPDDETKLHTEDIDNSDYPDKFAKYYDKLDFVNTNMAIGGSYALKQLTHADWQANDIDIFVGCDTKPEFDSISSNFEQQTGAARTREVWFSDNKIERERQVKEILAEKDSNNPPEAYHELIKGSVNYIIDDTKVQLVCFRSYDENKRKIEEIVSISSDRPACVTYRPLINGVKRFTYPADFCKMLQTRIIPGNRICPTRRAKYAARGWVFKD